VISDFSVDIYIRIHNHFTTFSEYRLVGLLWWPVAPFS